MHVVARLASGRTRVLWLTDEGRGGLTLSLEEEFDEPVDVESIVTDTDAGWERRFKAWGEMLAREDDLGGGLADLVEGEQLERLEVVTAHGDGWWVVLELDGGSGELRGLRFVPLEGADVDLSSRLLQRLRLGQLRRQVSRVLPVAGELLNLRYGPVVDVAAAHPGRGGRPDAFYASRASHYVMALKLHPDRPISWLVAFLDDGSTAARWRAWLKEAERRGLLEGRPGGASGRAGGQLTDKARRLISGEH